MRWEEKDKKSPDKKIRDNFKQTGVSRRFEPDEQPAGSGSIVYGSVPVAERLRSRPQSILRILLLETTSDHRVKDILELARRNGVIVERKNRRKLDEVSGPNSNHQGIVALVSAKDYVDADEIIESAGEDSLFVIIDGVEDPRNLGAIIRSAECAGADGVFIPERRAAGLTETVAKSSAGAVEHIPVARVQNLNRLIDELKEKNIWVVGAAGEADTAYTDWDWNRPTALVLGSEGDGLHRLVAKNCDVLVRIPMYGKIGSLNVSVAAGVILFEAQRQRANIKGS